MQSFLEIPVGSQQMAACLHRPEPGRLSMAAPLVICCHGLTGTRVGAGYRLVTLARRLVAQELACLRFDFRGCGESDGRFEDITPTTLIEDLLAAVASADHLPGCDPTRIGLVASSFGALTASLASGKIPALRCLAFWAPVASVRDLVDRAMDGPAWAHLREYGWVDHHGLRLASGFFDDIPSADAPAQLAAVDRPLLIFHGRGDAQVPIEHGRAYEKALQETGTEVRLEAIETDDHAMRTVAVSDRMIEATVAWMRRFLHPEVVDESTA